MTYFPEPEYQWLREIRKEFRATPKYIEYETSSNGRKARKKNPRYKWLHEQLLYTYRHHPNIRLRAAAGRGLGYGELRMAYML